MTRRKTIKSSYKYKDYKNHVLVFINYKNKFKRVLLDRDDFRTITSINRDIIISKGRNTFYAFISLFNHHLTLHRLIMNPKSNLIVDHINGNGLDNRRKNLRIVTYAQNIQNNHTISLNNTSGFRGVSWNKRKKKWAARVCLNNSKIVYQRYCKTKKEAKQFIIEMRRMHMPFSVEARL